MRKALRDGDMGRLEELVQDVQEFDTLRGDQLRELVEQYDYEKLQILLEESH